MSSIFRHFTNDGFEHPDPPTGLDAMRGHPTSPGPREEQIVRRGIKSDGVDGEPGVPRLRPTPYSQGPGIPGNSPAGPMQPGIEYEGFED